MRTTKAISVTLPAQMAEMVRARVESGEYASESDVILEGLRVLEERNSTVEEWLRDVGASRDDAYRANRDRGKDATDTWADIATHMDSRVKSHP